ncbi:MAG TPA: hypothetical protein VM422_01275, partial [Amaricoccus sp.]|nr:hypothetical protein [Amaricoccus sp.]
MRPASLAALTLAGVAVAAAAAAQQRRPFPPLPVPAATLERAPLTFTLSQSLEANTNYDLVNDPGGTTYYGETRFALDYLRTADTSLLSLGLDTGLRGVDHPDDDFEWVAASPSTAYLDYRAEGVDTLFDLGLTARSRIVDSTVFVEGDPGDPDAPVDSIEQVELDAREYRYDADIGFTGGTSSPTTWGVRILANTFD